MFSSPGVTVSDEDLRLSRLLTYELVESFLEACVMCSFSVQMPLSDGRIDTVHLQRT